MRDPNITIEFKGKETLEQVYTIHIENLAQAIAVAAGDKSLLREYELDLADRLAQVRQLQSRNIGVRS